jgi:thioesterase domain-containing protein
VVRVNDGDGPALFCVPGGGDGPLQYRALGRRLSSSAVHAFAYRGMDSRAVPDQSVEAIARHNVAAMLEVDRVGPYQLLGYSFGGAVAMEMARQLAARGAHVALLALLEPAIVPGASSRVGGGLAYASLVSERARAASRGADVRARVERLRVLVTEALGYLTRQLHLASAGVVRRRGLAQSAVFLDLHARILRAYTPAPYLGRTVVLGSAEYLADARAVLDPVLPPQTAGGARVDVAVSGEHLALVREPHVEEVARVLDALLAVEH